MEYWSILLSILIGALGVHYLFKNFNFFKRHGIIHVPSIPILGSLLPFILRRISAGGLFQKLYNFQPNAKYIGFYSTTHPVFLLRDPELIKDTLVKNFEAFPNRRPLANVDDPLFDKNLFSLHGQRWRDVRSLLSPAFTSNKMKAMFALMSECAVDFAKSLSTLPTDETDMDMKEAFTKYTNDVIATCAYGIKVDSMKDPANNFYIYGKEATDFSGIRVIKFLFLTSFSRLARFLGLKLVRDQVVNFFHETIKSTIAVRDAENITRPDMLQLMMDARGKHDKELSIEDMTAQAFIFYFGGFETVSTTMSFAAHEIAVRPGVQIKLRREIDEVLKESNGEVTYETINRLEYLDAVINEVLRLYPPVMFSERVCEKAYELPPALPGEKPFIMKRGMLLWVPIYAIHRDEKYYDDPEKFLPERFLNNKTYHTSPYYMPFGLGPRMCIANRFALLEVKVLLFHLLARCELKPCAKTTLPLKLGKNSITMIAEGGFWLKVQRRDDMQPTVETTMINNDDINA